MSLRDLEKRLEKEPDNLPLRVTVAGMLGDAGRRKEAVEHYRRVAVAYRAQGRVQQATAVCRSILELAPDDMAIHTLLAELSEPTTPAPAMPAPGAITATGDTGTGPRRRTPSSIEPTATGVRGALEPELPPGPKPAPKQAVAVSPRVRPASDTVKPPSVPSLAEPASAVAPTAPRPGSSATSRAALIPVVRTLGSRPPTPPPIAPPSPLSTAKRNPPPPPPPRAKPPTESPPRRSSFETETPLPQPVPYHVADPTSSQNRFERESADDVTFPEEVKRTRPRESDTSGLAEAARHISGLFAPNRSKPPTNAPIFEDSARKKRATNTPPVGEPARPPRITSAPPQRPPLNLPPERPTNPTIVDDPVRTKRPTNIPSAPLPSLPSGASGARPQRPTHEPTVAPLPPVPRSPQPTPVEELPPVPLAPRAVTPGAVPTARRPSSADEDLAVELDTRLRPRLSAEDLDKIASPPPTVPVEPVELDDELPTPLPTTPAARASRGASQPPTRDTPFEPPTDVHAPKSTRDTQRDTPAQAAPDDENTAPRELLGPEPLANAFFLALPQNRRDAALVRCIKRMVRAGQIVIRQGETSHPLYLVVTGQLELNVERANGTIAHLDTIDPSQYVGEASLLGRSPSPANLVAVVDSQVLALPPHSLFELAGAFPSLWAALKDSAERRTRQYEKILRG
ncbi:MAG: cyclic nucleotide-binding domain-containing protein [Kofleriaceae bacterium]